jgi:hypothetical protein
MDKLLIPFAIPPEGNSSAWYGILKELVGKELTFTEPPLSDGRALDTNPSLTRARKADL